MNDRIKKIDCFLKYFRDLATANPNYDISRNNIYYELTRLGVPEGERYHDNQSCGNFESWINSFYKDKNIDVFVDENWDYFCQFQTGDVAKYENHIKAFVPLNKKHIKNGTSLIFDFLSKNNIPHLSKVTKHIRNDGIIIKLTDIDDAIALQKFIDNTPYFKNSCVESNPFMINNGCISYTCDGLLSFNDVLSSYIKIYIDHHKKLNTLYLISAENFINFIAKQYGYWFVNKANNFVSFPNFDIYNDKNRVQDLKNITELFIKSFQKEFNFDSFLGHYLYVSEGDKNISTRINTYYN